MSLKDTIEKPTDSDPVIITLAGEAGTGKTTLACTFPNPIVIKSEDGLKSIPIETRPDSLPLVKSKDQLFDQLSMILKEDHEYKTLIIDSVTQLDTLFIDDLLRADNEKNNRKNDTDLVQSLSLIMGGYGAGFNALSALHGRVRKYAEALRERKNMHVVFVAHADLQTVDLPDQDPFSRYTLRLHKKSLNHYVDNVDMVGYVKLDTFTKGDKNQKIKKAVSGGERILTAYATANSVSKNRFGISDDIEIGRGVNPLAAIIKL